MDQYPQNQIPQQAPIPHNSWNKKISGGFFLALYVGIAAMFLIIDLLGLDTVHYGSYVPRPLLDAYLSIAGLVGFIIFLLLSYFIFIRTHSKSKAIGMSIVFSLASITWFTLVWSILTLSSIG